MGVDISNTPECSPANVPGLESDLQQFLARKLPQYMIPSTLTILSSMPIGRSGKTNRKALEAMVFEGERQEEQLPPTTENEKMIYNIWNQSFGFTGGIRTNFFHAGGNSMIMTKFFQEPTIFGLARIADIQLQHNRPQQAP
ncbi:hypothetical protein Pelo_7317 [Pelomyxa schiedti]|nr:hypothetical protein Pelo_7317 [Pelomyxa schiedti]